jgi:hypothetical protein
MDINKPSSQVNPIMILGGICVGLLLLSLILIFLFQNEIQTIKLLRNEFTILTQQKRIITASAEISEQYKDEIDVISRIFPNEQSIPIFIQALEGLIKQTSSEYTFRFNSLTPIVEGDKLFLLMTVTMKTDQEKLLQFLSALERLPYMTHITGMVSKTPNGYTGSAEVSIGMKVYVQNPFSTIK